MSERTLRERAETIRGYQYIRLKSGRLVGFWDMVTAVESAETALSTAVSRALKLAAADEHGLADYYLETMEWRLDRVESYIGAVRTYLEKLRGDQTTKERIALLRKTDGRTPEEAAAYRAKADELERRLKG